MARTHKTAYIKQRMAEEAREEEEAGEWIRAARTRSEKSAVLAKAAEERNARSKEEVVGADAEESYDEDAGEEDSDGENAEESEEEDAGEERREGEDAREEERDDGARISRKLLVVKENINVQRRNNTLRGQQQYRGKPDDKIPLVPAEWKLYQRKYICTHGWGERERSTTSKRKFHKLRRAGCPFQFLAQLAQDSDELNSDVLDGRYELKTEKTPRQKDGNSCGVFVCFQFWCRVTTKVHDDFTPKGMIALRWKMLRSIFSLIAEDT
ncbi:Hypothetical protein PHPALM_1480 [Phytophthora palmivora]|uniref:Cysteine protease family C48 n=1 Tax=Phytophthora palmivora TaxID=4796 RepID=A0A2P4YS96_9STRA|nr:Hypothetical protein PHPALM_1480 [Phytophthora palmivora]